MSSPTNLEVLLMNAKQLDSDALITLYDNYLPHVFRYIFYQVDNRATAEDITTKTFFRMLKDIPEFREDGKLFYPWLLKIAKSTLFDYLKTRTDQSKVLSDEEIGELSFNKRSKEDFKRTLTAAFDIDDFKWALAKLPDDQRQVLLLRFTMDLSNSQISHVLDIPEASVKSLQIVALDLLNKLIAKRSRVGERVEPAVSDTKRAKFRK